MYPGISRLLVEGLISGDHFADVKAAFDSFSSGTPHLPALCWIAHEAQQGVCEGGRGAGRNEETRFAIGDHLRVSSDSGRDHGEAGSHCLKDGKRDPFRQGRQDKERCPSQQARDITDYAKEFDMFAKL
jgi:hypothetical protein